MGKRINVAMVPDWFFSLNCFGHVVVPWLRVPQESTSLLFSGTQKRTQCCCVQVLPADVP